MAVQDEGNAPKGEEPGARPKKPVSMARYAVGSLLLVALSVVAFVEWDANRRSNASVLELERAMAGRPGGHLSRAEAEALIGRAPDGPGVVEDDELKVTYTWRGVFRRYPLDVYYNTDGRADLLRFEK